MELAFEVIMLLTHIYKYIFFLSFRKFEGYFVLRLPARERDKLLILWFYMYNNRYVHMLFFVTLTISESTYS